MDTLKRFQNIEALIGNTPLLEIRFRFKGEDRRIFAKAEHYNLTGSIKDRVCLLYTSCWSLNAGSISDKAASMSDKKENTLHSSLS